jgi:hypothetical protein
MPMVATLTRLIKLHDRFMLLLLPRL